MSWISVKDRLPEEGQLCEIEYVIPSGAKTRLDELGGKYAETRRPEFEEERDKPQRYKGVFYRDTPEQVEERSAFVPKHQLTGYGWGGLRVDLSRFVTHWQPLPEPPEVK